jgi:hypothetical protein
MNVSGEEDVKTPHMLSSLERQIHVFGDENTNVGINPSINFDNPRAFKLLGAQKKLNKKVKNKKKCLHVHLQSQNPLLILHVW